MTVRLWICKTVGCSECLVVASSLLLELVQDCLLMISLVMQHIQCVFNASSEIQLRPSHTNQQTFGLFNQMLQPSTKNVCFCK